MSRARTVCGDDAMALSEVPRSAASAATVAATAPPAMVLKDDVKHFESPRGYNSAPGQFKFYVHLGRADQDRPSEKRDVICERPLAGQSARSHAGAATAGTT